MGLSQFMLRLRRTSIRATLLCAPALALLLATPAPLLAAIWPTSGWPSATPAAMGMDSTRLGQARDYAIAKGGGSGFITRGGRVVMSWGATTSRYELKSSTKSIGVTLLGLAVQDGLAAVPDSALNLYAGFGVPPSSNASTGWLDEITLKQLATHTAGFAKPGDFISLIYEPGTTWSYSDGGANWLADVLTVTYGQDLRTVLFDRVLSKLGVTPSDLTWRDNAYRGTTIDGIPRREFGSGIYASVDAMARIGTLYLRGGQWESSQLIPRSFVDAARAPVPDITGLPVADPTTYPNASHHYGLLWWNNGDGTLPLVPRDAYWSWGLGESFIIVIPSLDIVVARAGGQWQSSFTTNYAVIDSFLTPIARSVVGAPVNQAPVVSAGSDQTVLVPATSAALNGSAYDDDLPSGTLSSTWTLVSGPSAVSFADPSSPSTTVTLGAEGTYVFRLTASDGSLSASDDVQVTLTSATGPAASWPFDDGTGTTALDSSGGGNPGTLVNGPTWTAGKIGQAVAFDGINDFVRVNDPGAGSALDLKTDFSMAAWVRFSSLPSSGSARNPRVLQKSGDTGAAGSYYLAVRTSTAPGILSLRLKFGGSVYNLDGASTLAVNRWYHVAAVKSAGSARLYLDGVQDGPTYTVPSGAPDANNDPLYIGESPSNSDGAVAGAIDDVRLYGRALSASEISGLALVAPDSTPPSTPATVTPTPVSPTRIDLSWTAASDPESGVASYRVTRDGTLAGTSGTTAFSDSTGLQPSTTYSYTVTAVNGAGLQGAPSAPVSATTPAPVNAAPTVSAGADQTITLPQTSASLQGTASDDGLPSGTLTTSWSVVSGPGAATFADASAPSTTVTVDSTGTYLLRLTATDGALSASDDVQVTLNPAPPPSSLFSSYLAFDGVDDYARFNDPGSNSALDLGADFTIGAWVRFNSLPSSGGSRNPRVLQKSADTGAAGSYYLAVRTSGAPGVLSLRLKFGGTIYTLDGAQTLAVNRRYFVTAVKQGSAVRLYLDGVQDGPTYTVPSGAPDANNDPLYVGESPSNSDGAVAGGIDDVRIYGRALSASEILATKDSELSGSEPGLNLYLPFNEAAGQTLTSLAPGGISGWRGSSSAVDSRDPVWAADTTSSSSSASATGSIASNGATSGAGTGRGVWFDCPSPNPSNRATAMVIHSDRETTGSMEIFDVRGRLVKRLLAGSSIPAGTTTVRWDGSTQSGAQAAAGIYIIRLRVGGEQFVQRMTRLK
ncbi:MAG TPA: LamG-like jellyroll fold domain-containing protein [Candidatus Eisenbacteria bacterium]